MSPAQYESVSKIDENYPPYEAVLASYLISGQLEKAMTVFQKLSETPCDVDTIAIKWGTHGSLFPDLLRLLKTKKNRQHAIVNMVTNLALISKKNLSSFLQLLSDKSKSNMDQVESLKKPFIALYDNIYDNKGTTLENWQADFCLEVLLDKSKNYEEREAAAFLLGSLSQEREAKAIQALSKFMEENKTTNIAKIWAAKAIGKFVTWNDKEITPLLSFLSKGLILSNNF